MISEKIDYSLGLIERALSEHSRPVVGCSFGKDSMAALHLVRRLAPDVEVVFVNTGVEFGDTVAFARRMAAEWNLKLTTVRPRRTFWKVVAEHGFPLRTRGAGSVHAPGRKGDPELRRQAKAAEACCETLKKKPMKAAIAEGGYDLLFDGVTAAESELRRLVKYVYGDYHYVKSWKIAKCHPLMDWTPDDVWAYHRFAGIPHNPLYDKRTEGYAVRTGCWSCTIPVRHGKLRFLREHYPRLWRILLKEKGLAQVMISRRLEAEPEDVDGRVIDDYLANHPCFFDQL